MKKAFFKGQEVRVALSFEAKNLNMGENLSDLLHSGQDWVSIDAYPCKGTTKTHIS